MSESHFVPASVTVRSESRTGQWVQISFEGPNETRSVVMRKSSIAEFVRHLLDASKVELDRTVDPGALKGGAAISPTGRDLRWGADGSLVLTFHLQTDDGARTLPVELSGSEVAELARDLANPPAR